MLSVFNRFLLLNIKKFALREKCPNTEYFPGLYFPILGLNTKIYFKNLSIQSEYGKIRTRKISVFGHFSHNAVTLLALM